MNTRKTPQPTTGLWRRIMQASQIMAVLGTLSIPASAQLIYTENFNTDGDGTRYTTTGRGLVLLTVDGNQEAAYWTHNTKVVAAGEIVGVVVPAPERRAMIVFQSAVPESMLTAEGKKLIDNTITWLTSGKANLKVVYSPGVNGEGDTYLSDRLTAAGHTVANDAEANLPVATATGLAIASSGGISATRYTRYAVPTLTFNGPNHDDELTSSIGAANALLDPGDITLTAPTHPIAAGLPAKFKFVTGEVGLDLVGTTLPDKATVIATYKFTDLNTGVEEIRPLLAVLEKGDSLLGGAFKGSEGAGYWAGADMNEATIDAGGCCASTGEPRSLTLNPINVSGKTDLRLSFLAAATDIDFEPADFLRVTADPDGDGPAEFALVAELKPFADAEKYFTDTDHSNKLSVTFRELSYKLPANATQLVLKFESMSTFFNEIVGFDNIRVHSGPLAPTTPQDPIANGLVAYWDFDGDLQDSIKDFHGTARGTNAIPFVDGRAGFGKAIKLNGNDQFVEITGGNENELEFLGGSMSIAGWFKVDAFDTGWQALISKGEGSAYRVARRDPTSTIAYAGGVGEGPNNTPNVNDGRWHHFVAVSDSSTNRAFGTALYIDGLVYSINTNRPALATNSLPLMIGENPGARNREWEGEIDDIGIWSRVLTPAEVARLYANPVSSFLPNPPPAGVTNGLVAYWDFDGDLQDSFKNFHGTARGTNAIPFVDGRAGFGKSIKLDGGNQFVEITGGNENELEFLNGSMSIAGWFTVDAFDTGWQALISKGEGSAYRVARRNPTDTIAYAGGVGEGPNNTPNVNDGQWHHFVAVTDANTNAFGTALYIDGAIYSINANKPALATNSLPLMIGENPGSRNREWEGQIDDISIWNRVLTAGEVAALQRKPLSAFYPGAPVEPYKIGLNFGAAEYPSLLNAGKLSAGSVAGVSGVVQANWNNLDPVDGTNTTIVADSNGASVPTTVRIVWDSNGTWASTGRSENNNTFPTNTPNRILMTGYLDTGAPSTTTVTISDIPASLAAGYDVYVYAQGGVPGRGGGYRIVDGANTDIVLRDYVRAQSLVATNSPGFVRVPVPPPGTNTHGVGNYIVFSGLTASNIRIEATTAGGLGFAATGTAHRAPINAIQLVKAAPAPQGPSISIARNAVGAPVITYTGTLQSSANVAGPYIPVTGATSPFTVSSGDPARFYRTSQP